MRTVIGPLGIASIVITCMSAVALIAGHRGAGLNVDRIATPSNRPRIALKPIAPNHVSRRDLVSLVEERPLFSESRRPREGKAGGEEVPFSYTLVGVVISGRVQIATLQGESGQTTRARLNEDIEGVPGWKLVALERRRAEFEGPGGKRSVELRVFKGGTERAAVAEPRQVAATAVTQTESKSADQMEKPAPSRTGSALTQVEAIRQLIEKRRARAGKKK